MSVLERLKKIIGTVDGLSTQVKSAITPVNANARKVPVTITRTANFLLESSPRYAKQDLYFTNGAETMYVTRMTAYTYATNSNNGLIDSYSSAYGVELDGLTSSTGINFDWTWNYTMASTGAAYLSTANNVPVPMLLSRTSLDWQERGRVLVFNKKRPQVVAAGDSLIVHIKPIAFPSTPVTQTRVSVAVTLSGYRAGTMAG